MKIFLDANVLFSASNRTSNIHLFTTQLAKHHELVTSDYAHEEARRNIQLKRPNWSPTFAEIETLVSKYPSAPLLLDIELVDKDSPILGAAIAYQCDYLLTGDKKDFGHLYNKKFETVTVIDYLTLAGKLINHG